MYTTLISVDALSSVLASVESDRLLILDCHFDLTDPAAGPRQYVKGHLPGALYVHLEDTLSGEKTGKNGRHPLPAHETLARTLATMGVNHTTQVVAYDNAGGMFAARLWWLLRWIGHEAVAVLDGGVAAWQAAGHALSVDVPPKRAVGDLSVRHSALRTLSYTQMRQAQALGAHVVLDARAPDRYHGEHETLDPVGGHIPGARNRFFRDNLGADGRFLPAAQLREAFTARMAGKPATAIIHQCGSGVTACHNLLAMEIAGLTGAALYAGSWSEWCAQADAPIATGAEA